MEQEFTVAGQSVRLSPADIRKAVRGHDPGAVRTHGVLVDGTLYPVKEVLARATGLDVLDFNTNHARAILRRLGFEVRRAS